MLPSVAHGAMRPRVILLFLLLLGGATLALPAASWTREEFVVIEGETVRALVPRRVADAAQPLVRRADALYPQLAADAGYRIRRPLWLWFGRDTDLHNGFSSVVPYPIIQVELAYARPSQRIFAGGRDIERTLIHELTHHISNDRNHGIRRVLESVFGRILPSDPISLALAYLSLPAPVFQPAFWQEGTAVWAESTYLGEDTVWAGRGRDPLTHMIWRLDAAADAIPPVGDWRLSYRAWPYGGRAYVYGTAYLRHLVGQHRVDVWDAIAAQGRQWPFLFADGAEAIFGQPHTSLLRRARAALQEEQEALITRLRAQPLTELERLTPRDAGAGAPAWGGDGRVHLALDRQRHRPRIHRLDADGTLQTTALPGHFDPSLRAHRGHLITTAYDHRRRAGSLVVSPDGTQHRLATRGIQPDLRIDDDTWVVATTAQDDDLRQSLRIEAFRGERSLGLRPAPPVQGDAAWSPTWQPDSDALLWVETDADGSRLVLGDAGRRRVLLQVPGRILHPCWDRDGTMIYFAADHSGVGNAYRLDLRGAQPVLRQITHVLGGVIACVPSPDGRRLALIDHDRDGPYLATMPLDPATWPERRIDIPLRWPAGTEAATPGRRAIPPPADDDAPLPVTDYHGLPLLRPRFWTPTTAVVPSGGFGAVAVLIDPLATHTVLAGAGIGTTENEPVGRLEWTYRGWPLDLGLVLRQSEITYGNEFRATEGRVLDYTETRSTAEVLVGRGVDDLDHDGYVFLRLGLARWEEVPASAARHVGESHRGPDPFAGVERYAQFEIGYDDRQRFPDGYAPDAGVAAALRFRNSGFGGDLDRSRVDLTLGAALPIWRNGGHQLAMSTQIGTSAGDRFMQGNFSVGGALGLGIPRGYIDRVATGAHLLAGSLAYRLPLWRPFQGFGSGPLVHRQLVAEVFVDAAQVSRDRVVDPDADWYHSVGALLHTTWEFFGVRLQPGLGIARQLDGEEDSNLLFELDFRW